MTLLARVQWARYNVNILINKIKYIKIFLINKN